MCCLAPLPALNLLHIFACLSLWGKIHLTNRHGNVRFEAKLGAEIQCSFYSFNIAALLRAPEGHTEIIKSRRRKWKNF